MKLSPAARRHVQQSISHLIGFLLFLCCLAIAFFGWWFIFKR